MNERDVHDAEVENHRGRRLDVDAPEGCVIFPLHHEHLAVKESVIGKDHRIGFAQQQTCF